MTSPVMNRAFELARNVTRSAISSGVERNTDITQRRFDLQSKPPRK